MEIKDNTFQRQFEADANGKLVTVEYSHQERKIFLTRIVSPEGFEDEEFIGGMLRQILDGARERNLKVVPTFPKIAAFFRKNPAYKDLLPPGIKI
ncbi:GNAT family N-acetyltransferase [Flavobacterium selenitireducens]|uniref:GNAT family N-acetyltransferase n=1 Tax=Flavobacterium selenitireducens TaxID=2722704 RepID=UPI00168B956A|nr:N-acetyltransferase [Flavobacterium selenitireducens]MBD3582798.1 N-acetyltransferase [Flavobacterium selenitireducens]